MIPLSTPVVSDNATGANVLVSWSAIPGATGYDIRRKTGASDYENPVHLGTVTSYSDSAVSSNTAYLYQVRATRSPFASAWSAPDLATTRVFMHADAFKHVLSGIDSIYSIDVKELRTLVDSIRSLSALPGYVYTYPADSGTFIHLEDISELRLVLDAARAALGFPALSYTDPGGQLVRQQTPFKAIHLNELRDGAQ